MEEYHKLVEEVLSDGNFKWNRTDVATISKFGVDYKVDTDRYPLLTTKKMDGFRWDSMLHELFWYLDGDHHIRNLQDETKIWDAWADDNGNLDTAYGRFWRNYPVPKEGKKEGESWAFNDRDEDGRQTFDQIQYVIDNLKNNPNSRRHVVIAWHPANAADSTLPPCHFTFVFNVQNGNELNLHLTQRSGDIALGIPFNIACYSLLQRMIAQEVDMEVGEFHHSIVDAHIYCGKGERARWWEERIEDFQNSINPVFKIKDKYEDNPYIDPENYDHIPGLIEQVLREPYELPEIEIADKPFDDLCYDDIKVVDYEHHDGIDFGVAE